MDLFKILDTTPEPPIIDLTHTSNNTSGDYWLPVPMSNYQMELTDHVISLHYSDILKYFETDDKDIVLLDSLEQLYLNSQLVSTHPYSLIKHFIPKNLTSKDTLFQLIEFSGKFQVLRDMLALLETRKLNIAIVSKSGDRCFDLLEALLLGSRVNIKRYAGSYVKDPSKLKQRDLTVHLVPTDVELTTTDLNDETFDLIFAIDITAKNELLHSLKKTPKTPILRFITTNSIDHAAMYFRKLHDSEEKTQEYLVEVTAAVIVLRSRIGVLPPDLRPIYTKNLTYLEKWAHDYENETWPLPEMSSISLYDSGDVERSLLREVRFNNVKKLLKGDKHSFYELKRLERDYSTNPLKEVNFGILRTNKDYNESLTHKLIQDFTKSLHSHNDAKNQLKHFKEGLTLIDEKYALDDETKLLKDLDHMKLRIQTAEHKSTKLGPQIEQMKQDIESLNKEIDKFKQDDTNVLSKINELKSSIRTKEKKEATLIQEKEYMTKEINNAKQSITDSESQIEQVKTQIIDQTEQFKHYFDEDKPPSSTKETVDEDEELQKLKELKENLQSSIKSNLAKLANLKLRTDNRRNSPSIKS
ncbi:hypothetical protein WICPIJ_005299 [Wickerhamomyces pijperi]|uniref:HDA1 complex subunit 3 n=1 Tax=Wickerhamomyces pijperi TaxID=599730 RepID=A0A9P8Q472_WICPI|nr:hypothetical protein WICPIJ_005299 [Wickerhamomyces pijperi]